MRLPHVSSVLALCLTLSAQVFYNPDTAVLEARSLDAAPVAGPAAELDADMELLIGDLAGFGGGRGPKLHAGVLAHAVPRPDLPRLLGLQLLTHGLVMDRGDGATLCDALPPAVENQP
ncbi:MAG: hypothetical protein R3F30_06175 [Planctomycetota bacterium]